jgi:hypothetical protein
MTPRLSELSDEQRRVLCAEGLGWIVFNPDRATLGFPPCARTHNFVDTRALPDPDKSADDALALCEHLAKEGFEVSMIHPGIDEKSEWFVMANDYEGRKGEAKDISQKRAITACFILAKGLATE